MIVTTKEEFRIIIYLIGYGIFIISTYDTLFWIVKKRNKILKTIFDLIYIITIGYFTYEFSYVLASGYIPIHFILFLILGFIIYFLIRKKYMIGLYIIYDFIKKIKKPIIKIIVFMVYPREIIGIISKIFHKIRKTILDFLGVLKNKNKKRNNKLSK